MLALKKVKSDPNFSANARVTQLERLAGKKKSAGATIEEQVGVYLCVRVHTSVCVSVCPLTVSSVCVILCVRPRFSPLQSGSRS